MITFPIFFGLLLLHLAGGYLLLTYPMRRRERSRLFVDVIEAGIQQGQSPEQAVIALSDRGEASMGLRFHLLAALLENGRSFSAALAESRNLLEPRVAAVLCAGEEMGDIRRVLSAARKVCEGSFVSARLAIQLLLYMALLIPIPAIFAFLGVKIIPQFQVIFRDMLPGQSIPPVTKFVFEACPWVALMYLAFLLAMWIPVILYLIGSRIRLALPGAALDRLALALPWRRNRLRRDFTMLLSILLDAGLPEARAVEIAARGTANRVFIRRALRVQSALRSGIPITQAIAAMENDDELQWRLDNARHGGGGFLRALSAWHETLDAKAFRQEEAAAHVIRTALILLNGAVAGLFAYGMFAAITEFISINIW